MCGCPGYTCMFVGSYVLVPAQENYTQSMHPPVMQTYKRTDRHGQSSFLSKKKGGERRGDRCACLSVVRPSVYLLACMPAVFRVRPLSSSERFGLSTLLKTKKRPKAWDQEFGSCPVAFFFSRRRIKKRRTNQ